MKAVVVYESMYGNTRAVAEAVAEGLGGAAVLPVHEAGDTPQVDLLIVGGPTHMHALSTRRSRQIAADAVHEDGEGSVEPGATEEPGLRTWLRDLARTGGTPAAAFDTRLDRSPWMTGAASRAIAKRLTRRGYSVLETASFLVEDSEGPLEAGELDRARDWGAQLARSMPVAAG
ncbi:MAG TPA: flavodoxin domain-containing protein [Solirubrobacteraceae bacterium]